MDKSLYNASGCKDRTAHDAICAADRTRTLVYRAKKFYGSGADWKKIYDANKTAIEKAAKKYGHKDSDQGDWIFPGTILTIP